MFKLKRLEITGFKSFADHTDLVFTGEGITAVVGANGCGKSNVADAIAWVLGEQRIKHLRGAEMKDVIFQGSRNRQASGMAEVVLHLVRDESTEDEPDIVDIDSTLEQIDELAVSFESGAGDELAPGALEAEAPELSTLARREHDADNNAVEAGADSSAAEIVGVEAPALVANRGANKGQPHKRHWRRRNLALEFAPGEAVSVSRRLYRSGESEYLLNDKLRRLRDLQDLFSGTGLAGGHYAIIEQGRIGQILYAKPMDRRTIN